MKINPGDAITLVAGLALGIGVIYAFRKMQGIASAASSLPERLIEAAGEVISEAAAAVADTATAAYDAAVLPRKGPDGLIGGTGWQFFPMEGVAIDPKGNYWQGTKIIWRAPE